MICSGITETDRASAEYFPDLNEASVGSANAPITALIRHRLLVFKDGEAYRVYSNLISLADVSMTIGFYISSVNKSVGCCAEAQAIVVRNSVKRLPITIRTPMLKLRNPSRIKLRNISARFQFPQIRKTFCTIRSIRSGDLK